MFDHSFSGENRPPGDGPQSFRHGILSLRLHFFAFLDEKGKKTLDKTEDGYYFSCTLSFWGSLRLYFLLFLAKRAKNLLTKACLFDILGESLELELGHDFQRHPTDRFHLCSLRMM